MQEFAVQTDRMAGNPYRLHGGAQNVNLSSSQLYEKEYSLDVSVSVCHIATSSLSLIDRLSKATVNLAGCCKWFPMQSHLTGSTGDYLPAETDNVKARR